MANTSKNIFGSKPLRRSQFDQAISGRVGTSSRRGVSGDPLTTGVNLAQQDLNNAVNIRNEHDDTADFYGGLSKLGGERPEGGAALLSGFFNGLSQSEKEKSTSKKQEALDKFDRVTEYFRQVNDQAMQMKEWYQKREFAQQKYMPQVLAYAENIDKLDPQSQRMMAQNILEGWNRTTGDDYKVVTIDSSDPFVMTVDSKDGMQVVDVRDLFAGDEVLQQRLAMKTPEYQMKLQQEREEKTRKADFEAEALEVKKYKEGIPSKFGQKQDNQSNKFGSIPLSGLKGKGTASLISTANAEMNLAKEVPVVLNMLAEGEQIIKDNPGLGKGWNNYLFSGDTSKTVMLPSTREAYEKLNKIANRIAETYIRAKGSAISESERETIKKGLFDVTNKSESNLYNIDSVRKELQIAKERGDFAADQLAEGYLATSKSFEDFKKDKQNSQSIPNENQKQAVSGTRIMIKTPDGTKMRIPESYLDQAIANGAEVIDG